MEELKSNIDNILCNYNELNGAETINFSEERIKNCLVALRNSLGDLALNVAKSLPKLVKLGVDRDNALSVLSTISKKVDSSKEMIAFFLALNKNYSMNSVSAVIVLSDLHTIIPTIKWLRELLN